MVTKNLTENDSKRNKLNTVFLKLWSDVLITPTNDWQLMSTTLGGSRWLGITAFVYREIRWGDDDSRRAVRAASNTTGRRRSGRQLCWLISYHISCGVVRQTITPTKEIRKPVGFSMSLREALAFQDTCAVGCQGGMKHRDNYKKVENCRPKSILLVVM